MSQRQRIYLDRAEASRHEIKSAVRDVPGLAKPKSESVTHASCSSVSDDEFSTSVRVNPADIELSQSHSQGAGITTIPGLQDLWNQTQGDPEIRIAVLDGPADRSHASLRAANIVTLGNVPTHDLIIGPASNHGTHVTSVIFGQHEGPIRGIAPDCSGLIRPIFFDGTGGSIRPSSQQELAEAINDALREGAHIINISGGEPSPSGRAHPALVDAVRNCELKGVLIVAAAGNRGCDGLHACDCVHVPGAMPTVLTVGAMNRKGEPLDFSNCGPQYQNQGLIVLGEDIPGALSGGGITTNTGTSFATPIVAGIAGLLMSLQLKRGKAVDAQEVKRALLEGADCCEPQRDSDCRRVLLGRINILKSLSLLNRGEDRMSVHASGDCTQIEPNVTPDSTTSWKNDSRSPTSESPIEIAPEVVENLQPASYDLTDSKSGTGSSDAPACADAALIAKSVVPQSCGCGGKATPTVALRQVYAGGVPVPNVLAFGKINYDFESDAKRDAVNRALGNDVNVNKREEVAELFQDSKKLHLASSFIWTIEKNGVPVCAIQPQGAFARDQYNILVDFLYDQEIDKKDDGKSTDKAEYVAITGNAVGQAMLAVAARQVPVIQPDYDGMRNVNIPAICEVARTSVSAEVQQHASSGDEFVKIVKEGFLDSLYDANPALAVEPGDRAQVYISIDAGQIIATYFVTLRAYRLQAVSTGKTENVPTGRNYQNVRLSFFNIDDTTKATISQEVVVDVTDVNPRIIEFRPLMYSR